ncbi:ribosome assembly cofactor RimP [Hugenholtzia roseola]|uniref:ribosome assembly cofactor RimP n=1 Tax=Hugenholtzia roseola TaxID=1002 RepID=UPI00041B2402|nr:ribosome assembly cofactor RimP [Hugenholtzia roseola]
MALALSETLTSLFNQALADLGREGELFLLDVAISGRGIQKVVFTVDGDKGVTIGQCADLSRKLGDLIEQAALFADDQPYELEVGSAGADQPLRLLRQYPQHIGRKLVFTLKDETVKKGKLLDIREEAGKILLDFTQEYEVKEEKQGKTKLKIKYQPATLDFDSIKEAQVEISFK